MSAPPLVLIDLSSVIYPIWHQSGNEPDPNWTTTKTVERVRALASGSPHVAICVDSPKSWRKELDPTYKANRPAQDAHLKHQLATVLEILKADGIPLWSADGFEADDVVASAVAKALVTFDNDILIISADKDLLQLVGPRVSAKSPTTGTVLDEAGVLEKFGVTPAQMQDYLALVGDSSDNIKGAKGIGPKNAAKLLGEHGTLAKLFTPEISNTLSEGLRNSLTEFAFRVDTVQQLLALRRDLPINVDEAFAPRTPQETEMLPLSEAPAQTPVQAAVSSGENQAAATGEARGTSQPEAFMGAPVTALAPRAVVLPTNEPFGLQLEPRNLEEAKSLAAILHGSRLFNVYGSPAAVLSTILAGRELGLQTMASLRGFHIVEGRPTLSADLIRALVLNSGKAKFFRCTARTADSVTWETQRGEDPPIALTYTMADAQQAGLVKTGSGWTKNPADMCSARASSKLARLVYADVVFNLYCEDEFNHG